MSRRVSRLAPSPTGALHLGNARTFLVNWALARREGWRLPMRIEDLDGPRVRAGAADEALALLAWLGIDFDGAPLTQSADLAPYRAALRQLAGAGLVYPCGLSRREIEAAASAPHDSDHELRYPPALRPPPGPVAADDLSVNYRFRVPEGTIGIDDAFAGSAAPNPFEEVGDFVIWTKRGVPAYQLAVVVDDARQGVTDVVRGDDLLPSAARQALLLDALGLARPRWWHLPLVLGPDGRRLAKRHGDTRLATYRAGGVSPDRVIGLLADWCGHPAPRGAMTPAAFRDTLDLQRVPRAPITFTEEDHRWLLEG